MIVSFFRKSICHANPKRKITLPQIQEFKNPRNKEKKKGGGRTEGVRKVGKIPRKPIGEKTFILREEDCRLFAFKNSLFGLPAGRGS